MWSFVFGVLGVRSIHRKCPICWNGWGQSVVTAGHTVYWVTSDADLLAYNVEKDIWIILVSYFSLFLKMLCYTYDSMEF